MSITKKLFAGVVTLAMVAVVAAPSRAQAQTVEQLMAQLAALQAQLAALQGGSTSGGACFTFTTDLTIGSTGDQVVNLQTFLQAQGFFTYTGAKGYFGPITQTALAQWQAANGVAPAAGYWGPISRAAYNAWCATQGGGSMDDDDDDDFEPTTGGFSGDGEADVEDFEVDDADDSNLDEGDEEVEVAEISFEVDEAQVMLSRLDLVFEESGANTEDDPWKAFDTLYLEYDGDVVAEVDAGDDDEWEEEDYDSDSTDEYRIRFRKIDLILDEGEHEFSVLADIANGLDGVETTEQQWDIFVPGNGTDGALFISPNGVTAYEPSVNSDRAQVDLGEAGSDAELEFSLSSESPDSTTLRVSQNTKEEFTVMVLDVRAEDEPVVLNEMSIFIDIVGTSTVAATTTYDASDVVDDVYLVGSGVDVDTDTPTGAATSAVDADNDGVSDDLRVRYDFDLQDNGDELELDEDEEVELEVVVKFKGYQGNYGEGTQVRAVLASSLVNSTFVDAESQGEDLGNSQISGSATGDLHVLFEEGIDVDFSSSETDSTVDQNGDTTKAIFEMEVEVSAFGDTFYIPLGAATTSSTTGATSGVKFRLENPQTGAVSSANASSSIVSQILSSSADEEEDAADYTWFRIDSGDTETFTVRVEVDNSAGFSGPVRLQLQEFYYSSTLGATTREAFSLQPASDYESGSITIDA